MIYRRFGSKYTRFIFSVVAIFTLLSSLGTTYASSYYNLIIQSQTTINQPKVTLQEGTVGTSTIYANSTSAKASVTAPIYDFVDINTGDVDSIADKGMHSNFTAQQTGSDSIYDTLTEENTEGIEDYVDNISDVDNSSDVGTHSNFENQKDYDSIYDTLTEQNTGGEITKVGTDTSGTGTSLTLSFSHTLVSGTARIVIVSIGVENGDTIDVSTVTYGGVTMTLAVEGITGTSDFRYLCEIWYILENDLPSDGSQTVEITCSGTAYELEVNGFCSEYTGVTQGAPEATAEHNQTTGTTITNDISPSDNAWVISVVGSGNAGSFTHGQGQVEVLDFQDTSSTFAVAELRGTSGETSLDSTYSGTVNRLERVAASWTGAVEDDNYELDLEIQFTAVIDFLPTETVCINTGIFSGTEDVNVDFWNGTGWENLATDLTAYSCNYYTVSLTSTTFTIRFKGGNETGDTTQDQWQIDASLLRVEGAGSKEDAVDQQSDVDSSTDVGTHSDFNAMKTKDGYDNLTEAMSEQQYTFFEDWESGSISGVNWSTYSSHIDGRIVVDTDSPYGGSTYALWMDQQTINDNLNELITAYNFSGATEVILSFYHNEQGDENTAGSDHTDHLNSDAVYFTNNGNYWYHLVDLVDPSDWTYVEINITAHPDFVSPANSSFAIKFAQFDNFYRPSDGRGFENINITYTTASSDFTMDLEVQWTDLPYLLPNENLSIYGGTMGDEDIKVDVWNGTGWENVFTDLSSGWNNVSITSWLTTSNFTIRFKGGNETGDPSQDTWQIDVALIHVWGDGGESYKLDLEVQWTSADYTRTNEELCIKTGTFTGSENIQVRVWNSTGSSWDWIMNLTANQWNNVSITSYLTSSTFTVQFLGGTETDDTTQDSWNIDATLLHVWTSDGSYDYVLKVNNTVTDSWQIRLKKYADSNIDRLQNCTIYFHNSTDGKSNQINIQNGSYINQTGSWYDLGGSETIYIALTVQANSEGTSHISTYLEVRKPDTTIYAQYVITFEIT